jgi:hypothetical protein
MANDSKGRWIRLSPGRILVEEMLRHAQRVPSVPVAKRLNVSQLAQLRQRTAVPISWTSIFIHAYSRVSQEVEALRTVYMPWPRPHLYLHPHTICKLAIERQWQGERVPLMAELWNSNTLCLEAIGQQITRFKSTPLWEISNFRQLMRLARLPRPLRRMMIWKTLYLSGPRRCKRMGTFLLTNYGHLGAESLHPISPHTTVLTLAPISPNGDVTVKLIYDHRVTDGANIARCLHRLDEILHGQTLQELRSYVRACA